MKATPFQTSIKIYYSALPQAPKILWPVVDIDLAYKKNHLPQLLPSLVDSGASHSILHPFVAEILGFNLKELGIPKGGGISASGEYESWRLSQRIDVNLYGYVFQVRFTVINNRNLPWGCILGGDSIFEKARLDFQKFKGYFELRFRTDLH